MPIKLALGPSSLCRCPSPRDGSWSCSHGRHHGAPNTSPPPSCRKTDLPQPHTALLSHGSGGKSVPRSQRALLLPGWAQTHPPAAPGVAPVPQEGMTGAESTALQPPQAGLLAPCPTCAPRLVLGPRRAVTCSQSLATTSLKLCPAVPMLCLSWSPVACETQQMPATPGSSLGRPLCCCPPSWVQLPEPQAGAGVRLLPHCGTGRSLQPRVPSHKHCLKCRHQNGASCEGLAIAGGTLDPTSGPTPRDSPASSAQAHSPAVPQHPWSIVPRAWLCQCCPGRTVWPMG